MTHRKTRLLLPASLVVSASSCLTCDNPPPPELCSSYPAGGVYPDGGYPCGGCPVQHLDDGGPDCSPTGYLQCLC